ncbi:MAG: 3,4-dihydroxy-2-butanone-4-phosphate synthase [Candidatus Micrarchaeia archaeon]
MAVAEAVAALRAGRFVVLFDSSSREGECDLVIHASKAIPQAIAFMRRHAGGLVCLATDKATAEVLSLPYFHELLAATPLAPLASARMPYGEPPAFSILISHRKTYTGVTDADRSLTIREFARLVAQNNGLRSSFLENFRSPGHVPLLIGRSLSERRGHTELALRLCELARLPPAVVLCEMLGKWKALGKRQARAFARARGLPFVEGRELIA